MFEIELKAHFYNKEKLIENLEKFAKHIKDVEKNDTYYHLPIENKDKHITVRIRKETQTIDKKKNTIFYLTYKKKEQRISQEGLESEMNDENESIISDTKTIEILFKDIGFFPFLCKQKIVNVYQTTTEFGNATIELCNIPKLGDFIEIEILSDNNNKMIVDSIQKKLHDILKRCEIPESQIENKYYSELLSEIK